MAKPELGTKRICPVTGRKFYDLNKNPVISPYTGEVVPIAPVVTRGRAGGQGRRAGRRARGRGGRDQRPPNSSRSKTPTPRPRARRPTLPDAVDDDIEVEDDGADDDSTFIEEDEEGDDDVTDIIGDGIEKDEET